MTQTSTAPANRDEGWGRVHLDNSLYFDGDDRHIIVTDQRDYFTTSTDPAFVMKFDAYGNAAASIIKVTLVWTDYAADPAASISLVNDLDLVVTDQGTSGTVYLGNSIDNAPGKPGYSVSGGSADTINNVEMVILAPTTTGTFEVRVEPSLIVEAPQGFALVIGGDVRNKETSNVNEWLIYGR